MKKSEIVSKFLEKVKQELEKHAQEIIKFQQEEQGSSKQIVWCGPL